MPGTLMLAIVLALALAVAFGLFTEFLRRNQGSMVFRPLALTDPYKPDPADRGLKYESVTFDNPDGDTLYGWWVPAAGKSPATTLLFCHGNAGHLADRLDSVEFYARFGLNVLIFDYRGYGLSGGVPSEEGLYADARTAWDYLTRDRGIDPARIVVLGRSLGGGVASELATRVQPAGLLLESTFTSIPDMAIARYPYMPVHRFLRYRFDTIDRLPRISAPVFQAHSQDDAVVPYSHGLRLAATRPDSQLVTLRGSHSGAYMASLDVYAPALADFLARHELPRAPGPDMNYPSARTMGSD